MIKRILRIAFFFYFKEISIHGLDNDSSREPLLYLPNHQNALLDALLIAVYSEQKPYFLTRSDVFSNPVSRALFKLLRMIPIYRLRDGRDSLRKNHMVFDTCVDLLKEGRVIVIFPEGNHNLRRQVRPLSKGFIRIIQHALVKYPQLMIRLVPIGINYAGATSFPDRVALFYGSRIEVLPPYPSGDDPNFSRRMKETVSGSLRQLTTHIDSTHLYEETLEMLDSIGADYLSPQKVNACIKSASGLNFKPKSRDDGKWYREAFMTLFSILNLFPVIVWKYFIKKWVPEPEFLSSYRFLFALFVMPFFYLMIFLFVAMTVGNVAAFASAAGLILLNLFYVKFG